MKCPNHLIEYLKQINTPESLDVIRVFEHGYEKHGEKKWHPAAVNVDCAYAHLVYMNTIEKESGLPHKAHAAARLIIAALKLMQAEGFKGC